MTRRRKQFSRSRMLRFSVSQLRDFFVVMSRTNRRDGHSRS